MADYSDSKKVSSMKDDSPFIRYVLGKLLNKHDQSIVDNTEVWIQMKKELIYYAILMFNMQHDTLWQDIMKTATQYNIDYDEINCVLEKYQHELIDTYESIMYSGSNEEPESQEEDIVDEQNVVERLPTHCAKSYFHSLKKRYY